MRVAVFDAVGTWQSAPTLRCIFEDLAARGAEVDVFLRLGGEGLDSFPRVRVRPFPVAFSPWAGDIRSTLRNWKWFMACSWPRTTAARGRVHYDLAIGVNPEGVIAAERLHRREGTPFAYLSFEMMFRDELPLGSQRKEKAAEVAASTPGCAGDQPGQMAGRTAGRGERPLCRGAWRYSPWRRARPGRRDGRTGCVRHFPSVPTKPSCCTRARSVHSPARTT